MAEENKQPMQPLLHDACERIRKLLAQADLGDSCARYEVGALIAKIKVDPDTYGANAVSRLESELGRGKSSLYRYGQVAERWDEVSFLSLLERKNRAGMPLSWRHLEVLSAVADENQRNSLIDNTIEHELTVNQLERMVRQSRRVQAAAALPHGMVRAREILRNVTAHARSLAQHAALWEAEVAPVLSSLPPDGALQLLGVTERAREQCLRAAIAASEFAARLQEMAKPESTPDQVPFKRRVG